MGRPNFHIHRNQCTLCGQSP